MLPSVKQRLSLESLIFEGLFFERLNGGVRFGIWKKVSREHYRVPTYPLGSVSGKPKVKTDQEPELKRLTLLLCWLVLASYH